MSERLKTEDTPEWAQELFARVLGTLSAQRERLDDHDRRLKTIEAGGERAAGRCPCDA